MPVFEYRAIATSGKATKGVIDADSPVAARRKLRDQQLHPTEIKEGGNAAKVSRTGPDEAASSGFGRVSGRDVALMTRQFAVLLHAGMPLVEALTVLIEQTPRPRLKKAVYDVRDCVNSGSALAEAMARHPRIFSALYTNMVGAGESSGRLEQILTRLADIQESQAKMRARILSTLAYPAFMAVFAVAIITFLVVVIVPRLMPIFQKQQQELPRPTEILMSTSHFIGSYWWLIILSIVGAFMLWRLWLSTVSGRRRWDSFKLRAPLFGGLHMKLICARLARTLGTMLESGLTMMKALDVVKSVLGNTVVEEAMDEIKVGVRRGKDLAQPLREADMFPPMLIHMVELGQRSGEIESMLLKVAETYDDDVQMTMDALIGLLEPVIICIMGIFVGFLVLSILLPILSMSKNI